VQCVCHIAPGAYQSLKMPHIISLMCVRHLAPKMAAGAGGIRTRIHIQGQAIVPEVDSRGVGPSPITIIFKLCA